ncbi:DUF6082 family protein [Nonomuraea jiangxiensis]|uniref:DUF6082 family protein n=1 Tax=Nonomuraea jiangxiensis TaxID=633440 RepID=UPI003CCBF4A4
MAQPPCFSRLSRSWPSLLRLTIDQPALFQADGSKWTGPEDDFPTRLLLVANAWVSQWWSMYALGLMRDADLRATLAGHFVERSAGDNCTSTDSRHSPAIGQACVRILSWENDTNHCRLS